MVLSVGLQTKRAPDAMDRVLRQAGFRAHRAYRPLRFVFGFSLQGLVHHLGYLLVLDRPRRPWTPLIVQARKPAFEKALAPLADRSSATASLGQPSAASRTISVRRTNPCGRLRERAIDANCSRSDSVSSNGANGRPNVISLSFAKGAQEKRTSRRSLWIDISTT